MLLAVDVGNTNVVFAVCEGREIRARWRIATDPRRTADQYAVWLIQLMQIEGLARDHGIQLALGETRRNITTRGIRLNDLVGRRFWVGEVLCEGTRLCEPCQYLSELTGKPLLRALVHRGGLRADIVRSGRIRRGDVLGVGEEGGQAKEVNKSPGGEQA